LPRSRFFSYFSAAILIVDSICATVTKFFQDFFYKTQVKAFANIRLIHRMEMCRFGLTTERTRHANMVFVSCEWSGLKNTSSGHFDLCTSRIQLLHVLWCTFTNLYYRQSKRLFGTI
jgi:hypothetical protein